MCTLYISLYSIIRYNIVHNTAVFLHVNCTIASVFTELWTIHYNCKRAKIYNYNAIKSDKFKKKVNQKGAFNNRLFCTFWFKVFSNHFMKL